MLDELEKALQLCVGGAVGAREGSILGEFHLKFLALVDEDHVSYLEQSHPRARKVPSEATTANKRTAMERTTAAS